MRGKRNRFGRAVLGALGIAMLSAALTGCSLIREWQLVGMTGGGSADAATSFPVEESDVETAVHADAGPNDGLPDAKTTDLPPTQAVKPPPTPGKPKEEVKPRHLVALTFDDGPDNKYTEQILDVLKEYDVQATFFLVGTQVKKYPDMAKRIVEEGHAIGNHTWSHGDLTKLSVEQRAEQIDKARQIIEQATGVAPRLMRAPYGALSEDVLAAIHDDDMKHVAWTVDTRDWAGSSVADMYKNVMANTRDGGIILMHSFGGRKNALEHTVKLLPKIIEDLRAKGYELVTVEEMIDSGEYKASVIK